MSKEEFQQFVEALKDLDTFQCIALTKKLSLLVAYFHYNLNFHNDNSTSITSWLGRDEKTLGRNFVLIKSYFAGTL